MVGDKDVKAALESYTLSQRWRRMQETEDIKGFN